MVGAGVLVVGVVFYQIMDRAFFIDSSDGTDYTTNIEWLILAGVAFVTLIGLVYLWASSFFASPD
ncbi:hypothetical protein [Cryobacterium sp. Hb1]|uniref:hypothetical protein n=1 Tax=Cryobacterium sp. Hb1 TaxID=1259147 RepID=UPI001069B394|nr:hypothetical protein [Cryobacterium sp. Hb1]TFD66069.1 hypothetical protein E3T38_13910 [Cryobacterium sp. Hb1]